MRKRCNWYSSLISKQELIYVACRDVDVNLVNPRGIIGDVAVVPERDCNAYDNIAFELVVRDNGRHHRYAIPRPITQQ